MDKTIYNTHEAKTHLSAIMARVEAGEEIIIARNGKAVAKIEKFHQNAKKPRIPGALQGQIWFDDDWEKTDPDMVDAFWKSIQSSDD